MDGIIESLVCIYGKNNVRYDNDLNIIYVQIRDKLINLYFKSSEWEYEGVVMRFEQSLEQHQIPKINTTRNLCILQTIKNTSTGRTKVYRQIIIKDLHDMGKPSMQNVFEGKQHKLLNSHGITVNKLYIALSDIRNIIKNI